ncbi:F-BAR domain only protein 2-like [Haliotis rubra]|uniref:F-BAR domain only protein 2-like n=1 Tax=Haliotis rubra TaxID=36100 RepID=UPI001EE60B61|nr:F-BAR domain only protein 2-like [Haliotis rubra]
MKALLEQPQVSCGHFLWAQPIPVSAGWLRPLGKGRRRSRPAKAPGASTDLDQSAGSYGGDCLCCVEGMVEDAPYAASFGESVDLFASGGTNPIPVFCSRIPDQRAFASDAFLLDWTGKSKTTGQNSPIPIISRSESSGSVTFNTTSMPIGSSRGPSPLTIGMSDTVPLAVAFTETINAFFKGHDATKSNSGEEVARNRCAVKTTGNLMMSFPAGIVKAFTENPSPSVLSFKIRNAAKLENVMPNTQLLVKDNAQSTADSHVFQFDMGALVDHLRHQGEQNKTASYFNIDIIKYQVRAEPGVESTPLPLVVYWKCEDKNTEYRLDYRYNASSMASPATLKNVLVAVNINGGVTKMNEENSRATWKLNDISEVSEQESQGCIRSKFELKTGPSVPSTTALQFMCEGTTLSGVDFELSGPGYRISLAKKRFASGKYYVDPEPENKLV